MTLLLQNIGRLPTPQDNIAIAIRTLPAGTTIAADDITFQLSHTVLEGHRFAIQPIKPGEALKSWGQPFGTAIRPIAPGDYVCNQGVLRELGRRALDFTLPTVPNFNDQFTPYIFDESAFRPSPPLPRYSDTRTFAGYRRSDGRGVGTRNMIVLLGTSSLTGGFVQALETRLKPVLASYPNIDGIVAVAHTEGAHPNPNNRALVLRTLSGFIVNPNVAAVLAVDYGGEAINNALLHNYLMEYSYPFQQMPHHFFSLSHAFNQDLDAAGAIVSGWLDTVNAMQRTDEPLSELKIALQCGGSDAFSGISANPLIGWVAREIVRYGGAANLAETDELIGAEAYMLENVKNLATAQKFIATLKRFQEWAGWHGHSAEGNPSGGNIYRGLYNIYLKSLGAATKRNPDVRVDAVIDYGEVMRDGGYYFMDSPGNDLESIAGQVASGCNLIFFTTGNGSITNFPFVPTIKVVTTTQRYELLLNEMDYNAGAYLDGTALDELGRDLLELTIRAASGELTAGEKARHSQVQIWRDWRQTAPANLAAFPARQFDGQPRTVRTVGMTAPKRRFVVYQTKDGVASDQIGLILPTSLCSGQIARMCANHLNEQHLGQDMGLSRFVTLVHTEGCGFAAGHEFDDTLLGYLTHPLVKHALLLEHGCEKTHNSYFRHSMNERHLNPADYGWASVQLDGGIQKVLHKMSTWFAEQVAADVQPQLVEVGLEAVRLGLVTHGEISDHAAHQLADVTRILVAAGGTVLLPENDTLLPENDTLLKQAAFYETVLADGQTSPTMGFAQRIVTPGLHIMETPTQQWSEILTLMGATGIELVLAHINHQPMLGHPLIPVLQVSENPAVIEHYGSDIDSALSNGDWSHALLDLIVATLAREYVPRLSAAGNYHFQITRGLLGVSM